MTDTKEPKQDGSTPTRNKSDELLAHAVGLYIHRLSIDRILQRIINAEDGGFDPHHDQLDFLLGKILKKKDYYEYYHSNTRKIDEAAMFGSTFYPDRMTDAIYDLTEYKDAYASHKSARDIEGLGYQAIEEVRRLYKLDKAAKPISGRTRT